MSSAAPGIGDTIAARLTRASARRAPVAFVDAAGGEDVVDAASLDAAARAVARRLRARGLGRGDRIAVVGFTTRALVEALLGAWQLGATVSVLPIPMRQRDAAALGQRLWRLARSLRVRLVIADPPFRDLLAGHAAVGDGDGPALLAPAELAAGDEAPLGDGPAPSDLAVLQLTSGSSGPVKTVCLTHAAVCANLDAVGDAARLTAADHALSWLPLYHDMGLIGGLLVPLLHGIAASWLSPHVFALRPASWMDAASRRRATVLVAPSFGYSLAARTLDGPRTLDLSAVRIALCGAEPVSPAVIAAFLAAGRRHGLAPDVILPAYGLAEATLAVAVAPPSRPLVIDRVARAALEHERVAVPARRGEPAKEIVGLGRPVRGTAVRIVDRTGAEVAERVVGEICVAGGSLLAGYEIDGVRQLPLDHGWLRTGDLGYVVGDELFVCGRDKDLIIVRGRNLWPDDVERVAASVAGVRAGNVCAFGIDDDLGREDLILVAECGRPDTAAGLATAVLGRVTDEIGIAPRQVVILAPSALPKTSSGKLRRPATRELYLAGSLEPVDQAGGAPALSLRPGGTR